MKITEKIKSLNTKEKRIISIACATWGIILITSGSIMTTMIKEPTTTPKTKLSVTQKRVSETKSNEIKLKELTLEVNQPLSVDAKDYLEKIENIETKVLNNLKLDTSNVNVTQAGTYTYTITYKKKKYNGTIIIKEKEVPQVELTLKNISLELGSSLPTDMATYINETLTDEIKMNIKLDLTNVNTAQAGTYQYSVTFNGKLYTGNITIYQPQVLTPPASSVTPPSNQQQEEKPDDNKSDDNITTETP